MSAHAQWPPPIHWSGHSEVGRHETFTRRIAKERQEIARFVPKKHLLLLLLKNWSVHTGTNYEFKGSEKHQITKQSEGIEICLGDV